MVDFDVVKQWGFFFNMIRKLDLIICMLVGLQTFCRSFYFQFFYVHYAGDMVTVHLIFNQKLSFFNLV
jgi:hypothetical protein